MPQALTDRLASLPTLELLLGEALLQAGTTTGKLFFLKSGELAVVRDGVTITRIREPGAIFGEMSLLLEGPHTADVIATEPSVCHIVVVGAMVAVSSWAGDGGPGIGQSVSCHRSAASMGDLDDALCGSWSACRRGVGCVGDGPRRAARGERRHPDRDPTDRERTRAPSLSSFRRIVPAVAWASRVAGRARRRRASTSTSAIDAQPQTQLVGPHRPGRGAIRAQVELALLDAVLPRPEEPVEAIPGGTAVRSTAAARRERSRAARKAAWPPSPRWRGWSPQSVGWRLGSALAAHQLLGLGPTTRARAAPACPSGLVTLVTEVLETPGRVAGPCRPRPPRQQAPRRARPAGGSCGPSRAYGRPGCARPSRFAAPSPEEPIAARSEAHERLAGEARIRAQDDPHLWPACPDLGGRAARPPPPHRRWHRGSTAAALSALLTSLRGIGQSPMATNR